MSDDSLPEYNPHAKAALLSALEEQLESSDTPEVQQELDRLVASGVEEREAKDLMATVLAFHIARLMRGPGAFDYAAYLSELRQLPEIDYDQPL